LNIDEEIKLLVEIKDILDEINIILMVLRSQRSVPTDPELPKFTRIRYNTDGLPHLEDAKRIITTSANDFMRM
jgi:hypothetical protein